MLSSRLFPSYRRYRLFFRRLVKLSEVIRGGGGGSSRQSYSTTVQFGCGGRTGGSSSWGSSSSNSSNHHHYHHHHHHHRRVLKMGALWSATTASGLLLYSALASGGNSDEEHYRQLLASRSPMLKKAGMLAWEENRITDEELEELLKEFILIETIKEKAATATTAAASPSPSTSPSSSSSTSTSTSTPAEEDNESYCKPEQMETASSSSSTTSSSSENGSFMAVSCLRARATATSDQDWEEVIKQPNFYVWRKAVNNSSLYEYKVFGSFFDISAYAFYAVQRDLEFRKQWDKLVLKLDIVEVEPSSSSSTTAESLDFQEYSHNHQCPKTAISSNQAQSAAVVDDTGNELVHWVMKYPYPMKSREYLFLRRSRVDYARSTIATVSRSVPYPEIPETEEHVRVYDYISQMVIRPHSLSSSSSVLENSSTGDFHALGFDYLLTYFDDTRAAFPSAAYNWMASRGVPDFVEKLHQAALHLTESGSLPPPPPPQNRTSTAQLSSSSAFNRDGFSLLYLKSNSSPSSSSPFSPQPPPPPPRQS